MGTVHNKHTEDGREIVDSTPMAIPMDFKRPPTIQEMVQRYVRYAVSEAADKEGFETFEEADDFDTGEDEDIRSPYQLDDEQEHAQLSDFAEEQPKAEPDPQPKETAPDPKTDPKPTPKARTKAKADPKDEPEPQTS